MKMIPRLLLMFAVALAAVIPLDAHAARKGLRPLMVETTFMRAGASVDLYVATTGSDVTGDGTALAPYATVPKALSVIPPGFLSTVTVNMAAGTYSSSGTNWAVRVLPGTSPTGTAPTVPNILGACTPIAMMSTVGTGTVVTANGVQKIAQYTHTPTVTSGTLPTISGSGTHYIRYKTTSTAPYTFTQVLSGDATTLVLEKSSNAAITNSGGIELCTYETVVTQTGVQLGASSTPHNANTMSVSGIKFTAAGITHRAVTMRGVHMTAQSTSLICYSCIILGSYFANSGLSLETSGTASGNLQTTVLDATPVFVYGDGMVMSFNLHKGTTTGPKISVGDCWISSNGCGHNQYGGSSLQSISSLDFEGSGTGISTIGAGFVPTSASGVLTFDITGAPLIAKNGSHIYIWAIWRGKATAASQIRNGSQVLNASTTQYAITNTANAGQDFIVGSDATPKASNTTATDVGQANPEFCRLSASAN